jgi:hypothetical protein
MSTQLRSPRRHPRPRQDPAGPGRSPGRRRPVVIALVSVATAVWLVAQTAAGFKMIVRTWPVVGFPMFAENRSTVATRVLELQTRDGRVVVLDRLHFGMTELQFRALERSMVTDSGMVSSGASERLAMLAGVWDRAHPTEPAAAITLTNLVRPLEAGGPPGSRQVVRWERS